MLFLVTYKQISYSRYRSVEQNAQMDGLKGRDRTKSPLSLCPSGAFEVAQRKCNPPWKSGWRDMSSCPSPQIIAVVLFCVVFSQSVVWTVVMHWGRDRERKQERVKEGAWKLEREGESVLRPSHWLPGARHLFASRPLSQSAAFATFWVYEWNE